MNQGFLTYITTAKSLATDHGISWDVPVDSCGLIAKQSAWDLTAIAGVPPPPTCRLNDLGGDKNTIPILNRYLAERNRPSIEKVALLPGWQELIKAATIHHLLVLRNSPRSLSQVLIQPLKVLGMCVQALGATEPWQMTWDDVQFAWRVAAEGQPSGTLGERVKGVIRGILDTKLMCDHGPFCPMLPEAEQVPHTFRKRLRHRKSAERLPNLRAFWELVRIVFTERPLSFPDALRFAQIKILILCGLRVGEVCMIPVDWKRVREYVDVDGNPAGIRGGVSRSLMLRHFAEKQRGGPLKDGSVLCEATQYIPAQFEHILEETLDSIATLTSPLRQRLRRQRETNRMFPELGEHDLVPLTDLYVRLTGNPILRSTPETSMLIDSYRSSLSIKVVDEIIDNQARSNGGFTTAFYAYWIRVKKSGQLPLRLANGKPQKGPRLPMDKMFAYVNEVEHYIRTTVPTKVSDTSPFRIKEGTFEPDRLMFLVPKRPISETRIFSICDVTWYFAVGRASSDDLMLQLAGGDNSIYGRYGQTAEDRKLQLNSHSLRHLQTTELFRLGIADTMITKRYNRRSVAQSYEYDHRTLAEELTAIELPPAADVLPEKARNVAAMITLGRASGPIIEEFKAIQKKQGDIPAFQFLAAEADGFHVTPYGHCLNSFTVDPCPKHLQCFDGCKHLVLTQIDRHRANLENTKSRLLIAVNEIEGRKGGIGRENQLSHARKLVQNIDKVLGSQEGDRPFPNGVDLSERIDEERTPLDGRA